MRSFLRLAAVFLAVNLGLLSISVRGESRTWKDDTGQFEITAEFIDMVEGQVRLRTEAGREVTVPVLRLSQDDRRFIREELRRRRTSPAGSTTLPSSTGEAAVGGATGAGDWPQWRGPERNAISQETGLLDSWPESGPPLAWTAHGLGRGMASVAVVGDRIYTTGRIDRGAAILCLSREDGRVLWSAPLGDSEEPNGTPTVADGRVYAVSKQGHLVCVSAETGEVAWKKNFGGDFGGRIMSDWGYSESPLVDQGRLICTPGSKDAALAALDPATGRTLWTTPLPANTGNRGRDGAGYASVIVSQAAGVRQYVQLIGRGLIGAKADDGTLLWGYNRIANDTANIPTAIAAGDFIFSSTGYSTGSALLKIEKQGRALAPREIYFLDANQLQNHHGGMVLLGDYLYCGHGHNNGLPVCLHLPSGRAAWGPVRGPGADSAAVVYADGHLYFRYQNGIMALIEANPKEYKLKGSFRIATRHGESWPHPVVAGGRLYLRDQNNLHCYDIRKP